MKNSSVECVLIYCECLNIALASLWRVEIPLHGERRRSEQKVHVKRNPGRLHCYFGVMCCATQPRECNPLL